MLPHQPSAPGKTLKGNVREYRSPASCSAHPPQPWLHRGSGERPFVPKLSWAWGQRQKWAHITYRAPLCLPDKIPGYRAPQALIQDAQPLPAAGDQHGCNRRARALGLSAQPCCPFAPCAPPGTETVKALEQVPIGATSLIHLSWERGRPCTAACCSLPGGWITRSALPRSLRPDLPLPGWTLFPPLEGG